jgi:hypothetical protein
MVIDDVELFCELVAASGKTSAFPSGNVGA